MYSLPAQSINRLPHPPEQRKSPVAPFRQTQEFFQLVPPCLPSGFHLLIFLTSVCISQGREVPKQTKINMLPVFRECLVQERRQIPATVVLGLECQYPLWPHQKCRLTCISDLPNQNLHFNEIPGWFKYTLKFWELWSQYQIRKYSAKLPLPLSGK